MPPWSCPPSLLSFPTFSIGNPEVSSQSGETRMKGQKNKTGFPLETCGNDRRGPDVPPLVIPDVSNRESKVFPKQGIHE